VFQWQEIHITNVSNQDLVWALDLSLAGQTRLTRSGVVDLPDHLVPQGVNDVHVFKMVNEDGCPFMVDECDLIRGCLQPGEDQVLVVVFNPGMCCN